MKEKIVIDVEITSLESSEISQAGMAKGFYLNTNTRGEVALLFASGAPEEFPSVLFIPPSLVGELKRATDEQEKTQSHTLTKVAQAGITGEVLLRAIAIAQDPNLAKELLK